MANLDAATYERIIETIHRIDTICDDHVDLYSILRYALRELANELESDTAFVYYLDAYDDPVLVAVDRHGLIKKNLEKEVTQLSERAAASGSLEPIIENELFESRYGAVPMRIGERFIGLLGVNRDESFDEVELRIISEVGMVVDSAIGYKTKEEFGRDERALIEEVDHTIDANSTNVQKCLEQLISIIVTKVGSVAGFIFDLGADEPQVSATNDAGRIMWENYEPLRINVLQVVQECVFEEESMIVQLEGDTEQLLAGKPVRSILGVPMMTKAGESAGALVIVSYSVLSSAHRRLVESAACIMDTAIINEKHTRVMVSKFSKYVGTEMMDSLLENPEWLDPRREEVVILSADLYGSTDYSHREQNAFSVFNMVNQYLGMIGEIVKDEFGGTLDKYIGDEVMGVFGAPLKDVRSPQTATECAKSIIERMQAFNKDREETLEVKLTLGRVEAICGEIGSENTQTDYTVIGPGVNQFFRIAKHHGQPNRIIINDGLHVAIRDQYNVQLVDNVTLKGVPGEVPLYEVMLA